MKKNAQERGIVNKFREKLNMPGSYVEGFFKPELDRVMNSLRQLDDNIRTIMTGKEISTTDGAVAGLDKVTADGVSAKELIKNARSNFNHREYLSGVADLGQFHKKMFDIAQQINRFKIDVDKIHHKFLFNGMPESYQNNLKELRKHMERKAGSNNAYFIKEAGIMDFFYNIRNKRGRSLMAWEKKYPKKIKALRDDGIRLIDFSEKFFQNTLINLKDMATARAIRRPDDYMEAANRIKADFDKFDGGDKGFKSYYTNSVLPWLELNDKLSEPKPENISAPVIPAAPIENMDDGKVELGDQEIKAPTPAPVATAPVVTPAQQDVPDLDFPQKKIVAPVAPAAPIVPPTTPTIEDPNQLNMAANLPEEARRPDFGAHASFYKTLEKLSNESPRILAGFINKYAKSIQTKDLDTSIKLFKIANQIRG